MIEITALFELHNMKKNLWDWRAGVAGNNCWEKFQHWTKESLNVCLGYTSAYCFFTLPKFSWCSHECGTLGHFFPNHWPDVFDEWHNWWMIGPKQQWNLVNNEGLLNVAYVRLHIVLLKLFHKLALRVKGDNILQSIQRCSGSCWVYEQWVLDKS